MIKSLIIHRKRRTNESEMKENKNMFSWQVALNGLLWLYRCKQKIAEYTQHNVE
jgi:hypothetical protein